MFFKSLFCNENRPLVTAAQQLLLIFVFSMAANSAEVVKQSSRIVTALNDGGTPGLGSGKLESTAIVDVCEVTEVDDEALRFAVLQGLGPFYIAEDPKSDVSGQAYKSQRFLLETKLLDEHDDQSKQATLSGGKFFSMEMTLEALASPKRRKVSLSFTTILFSGTSNDVRRHEVAGGAYDGRFFHEEFAGEVLSALQTENCREN